MSDEARGEAPEATPFRLRDERSWPAARRQEPQLQYLQQASRLYAPFSGLPLPWVSPWVIPPSPPLLPLLCLLRLLHCLVIQHRHCCFVVASGCNARPSAWLFCSRWRCRGDEHGWQGRVSRLSSSGEPSSVAARPPRSANKFEATVASGRTAALVSLGCGNERAEAAAASATTSATCRRVIVAELAEIVSHDARTRRRRQCMHASN